MKKFYAGAFLDRNYLKTMGIEYPVKLEYYKTRSNNEKTVNEYQLKYGIEIVKTSYNNEKVEVENTLIEELTKDEKIIDRILDKLKINQVTPVCAEYIVEDLLKEIG